MADAGSGRHVRKGSPPPMKRRRTVPVLPRPGVQLTAVKREEDEVEFSRSPTPEPGSQGESGSEERPERRPQVLALVPSAEQKLNRLQVEAPLTRSEAEKRAREAIQARIKAADTAWQAKGPQAAEKLQPAQSPRRPSLPRKHTERKRRQVFAGDVRMRERWANNAKVTNVMRADAEQQARKNIIAFLKAAETAEAKKPEARKLPRLRSEADRCRTVSLAANDQAMAGDEAKVERQVSTMSEEARLRAEEEEARLRAEEEEAKAKAKADQEARAKAEQEAKAKAEAAAREAAKAKATKAKAEQEARAKAEQQTRAKAEQEVRAKAEQQARAKAEQEARARAEQEARAKAEQDARSKAEQEAKARAELEAKARVEQEDKARAELEARATAEEAKAKAEQDSKSEQLAKAKAEQEAKARAKAERAEARAKRAEALSKAEKVDPQIAKSEARDVTANLDRPTELKAAEEMGPADVPRPEPTKVKASAAKASSIRAGQKLGVKAGPPSGPAPPASGNPSAAPQVSQRTDAGPARADFTLLVNIMFKGKRKTVKHQASTKISDMLSLYEPRLKAAAGSDLKALRVCDENGVEQGSEVTLGLLLPDSSLSKEGKISLSFEEDDWFD